MEQVIAQKYSVMKKNVIFVLLISIQAKFSNNVSVLVLLTPSEKLALNATGDASTATDINLWTVWNAKINLRRAVCMPQSGFSGVFATWILVFIWIPKLKIIPSVIRDASHALIHRILAPIAHLERLLEVTVGNVYLNVLSDIYQMTIVQGTIYARSTILKQLSTIIKVKS